jgi:hypothetical protein
MKMYLNVEQTAKLIELGFEKPKASHRYWRGNELIINNNYSIGELLEMLPKEMDCELGDLGLSIENNIYEQPNEWIVSYDGRHQTNSIELVDALYDMVVKLKEEGVI